MSKQKDRTKIKDDVKYVLDGIMKNVAKGAEQKTGISGELLGFSIGNKKLFADERSRRIQAALLATKSIPTEALEAGVVGELLEAAKLYYDRGYGSGVMRGKLGAAIHKAEGGE